MNPENKLHYHATSTLLLNVLKILMACNELAEFRLVGGTALSLLKGHRQSADIDLFTDAEYGSIDFDEIDQYLRNAYPYVDTSDYPNTGMGKSYFIGYDREDCIKLDLFYTDKFIDKILLIDDIRLASVGEIIAMKLDVISRGGRKKDFWDIHELMNDFTLKHMLDLHKQRYPYSHDPLSIREKLTDFNLADRDFDPICLLGKHWELIKLDLMELARDTF